MRGVVFRKLGMIAAAGMLLVGMPAIAANGGYDFLKAVRERDGTAVTKMLDKPGNTLILSEDERTGETALHIAVSRRDEMWTKFFLDRGARPNKADKRGITPLALASSLGFAEGVEVLLKRGAQVDTPDATGETPLIAAVHRRDLPMIRLLMANGANADRNDNSGRSARDYARLMGASVGVEGEIVRAEAERNKAPAQDAYGPSL